MSKRILIVGSGHSVWDDLEKLGPYDGPWMALNNAGILVQVWRQPMSAIAWGPGYDLKAQAPLTHWFSVHGEKLQHWKKLREMEVQLACAPDMTTYSTREGADVVFGDLAGGRVSSALPAIRSCFKLGFEHVVLAGIPMDNKPHFYGNPRTKTPFVGWIKNWEPHLDELRGRVEPLSGELCKIL